MALFVDEADDSNVCDVSKSSIPFEYRWLIYELVSVLTHRLNGLIDSIYLFGQVVHGASTIGESALGVTIILNKLPSTFEELQIEQIRKEIHGRHQEVSRIVFDIGLLSDIANPRRLERWRVWFRDCCICVYRKVMVPMESEL